MRSLAGLPFVGGWGLLRHAVSAVDFLAPGPSVHRVVHRVHGLGCGGHSQGRDHDGLYGVLVPESLDSVKCGFVHW